MCVGLCPGVGLAEPQPVGEALGNRPDHYRARRPLLQTALHFLVCSISIWFSQKAGMIKKTSMPINGARL